MIQFDGFRKIKLYDYDRRTTKKGKRASSIPRLG